MLVTEPWSTPTSTLQLIKLGRLLLLNYHLTVVDAEIESESVLNVWVGVDHLEVCPLSTAEMFPLDQRNDCQVSVLAPHFSLCQQTNVPVRCWDTKIEIFIEILAHLTFIENMILILPVFVNWPVLPLIQRGLLVDSRQVHQC